MKKRLFIFFISLLILTLLYVGYRVSPYSMTTLPEYADQILSKCKNTTEKVKCYETEIPELMKLISMEDSFRVTSLVQQRDFSFPYCHVLGHELASLETRKDPSKWQDVVARCPAGVCSNGCVHGAFQEKFREEAFSDSVIDKVKQDLANVCEGREGFHPSGLEQSSCYHALGHLMMYITTADTDKAIALCDELALKQDGRDFRKICYDGAFMQIFQPLEVEDRALVMGKVPKKEDVQRFCFKYQGEARSSCWNESWPLFFDEITTPEGLISFCSKLDKLGKENCTTDILYVLPIQFQFNTQFMTSFCNSLSEEKDKCFAVFATRLLEIDYQNKQKAINFCNSALTEEGRGECLMELISYANFVFQPESKDYENFCNLLPQNIKNGCFAQRNIQ